MFSKTIIAVALASVVSARFGEEQVPIPDIQAVTSGGAPGEAATIAGAAISDLLAAANPCAKLQRGDEILNKLGNGADAVKAAIGMVAAEQNFNPFETDIPSICADAGLPKSQILRGITPLIDPAVQGAAAANALSKQTASDPLNADGKSVADLLIENGFDSLKAVDAEGNTVDSAKGSAAAPAPAQPPACNAPPVGGPGSNSSANNAGANAGNEAAGGAGGSSGVGGNSQTSTIAGADFGKCVPTMEFGPGINGRGAEETFLPIDPLVAEGQQEALNPNIITNRICDQLVNVCNANAKAQSVCADAQAKIEALGTADASTARQWNALLGFAGASIAPVRRVALSFAA